MAPVYFIAVFVLATFFFIPLVLLSTAGGFLFGVFLGIFLVVLGATISSGIAYLISHFFLRNWVRSEIQKHRFLRVIDHVVKNGNWKVVILSRVAPIFPFLPLNLAYGVSKIRYWKFIFASFIGFLPGTFLGAYLGSIAGTLIGAQERAPLPGEKFFLVLSVTTAIFATLYMTKLTRQALAANKMQEKTIQCPPDFGPDRINQNDTRGLMMQIEMMKEVLQPENTWKDAAAYRKKACELARMFDQNFKEIGKDALEAVKKSGSVIE